VQHALQEIQKVILFVRTDRSQFAISGLNWTPVHWFTEFVDLSLAQDLFWSCRDGLRDIGKNRCR
jgi:hypothetical protein